MDSDDVALFWDYENCPLPASASGYTVVNNIRCMAQSYGSVKSLRAYLGISEQLPVARTLALRSELQSSGVSLVDCPHNGRKDVADKMIIVDMMAYAIDNPAPSTLILITGDRDFAYVMSILRLRRYQIILVTLPTAHASLTSQASICIDWLSEVLEPVQRPPNVTGNRTELTSLRAPPLRDRPGENSYPPSRTSSSPQYVRQPMDFSSRSEEVGDLPQFLRIANQRRQSPHSSNSGRAFVPERNQPVDLTATTEQLEIPNSQPIITPFGPSGRNMHQSASPLVTQITIPPQTQRQNLLPSFVNKLSNVALMPDKLHDPGLPIDGNTEDTSTLNQTTNDISPPAEEFAPLLPSQRPASAPGSLPSSPPTTNQGSPVPYTPIMPSTSVQELPSVGTLPGANKSLAPIEVVVPLVMNPPILAVENTEAVKQSSSPGVTVAAPSATLATVLVPSKQTSTIPAQQSAIGGPTVPLTTSTPVVPPIFRILVESLQSNKSKGLFRPLRSNISMQIAKNGLTYKAAGVAKFSQYVALAEKRGIVEIGGSEGNAWIALKPDWYNASLS